MGRPLEAKARVKKADTWTIVMLTHVGRISHCHYATGCFFGRPSDVFNYYYQAGVDCLLHTLNQINRENNKPFFFFVLFAQRSQKTTKCQNAQLPLRRDQTQK